MKKYVVFLILCSLIVYQFSFTKMCGCNMALAADVKPGVVIDQNNWEKYKDVLVIPYRSELKEGLVTMRIMETKPVKFPRAFNEATRRNVGKTSLDKDGGLVNYVAGIPFPKIDPQDPQAGNKLVWNQYWHWMGDDYYLDHADRWCTNPQGQEILAGTCQAFLRATGRVTLDPKPAIPGYEDIETFFVNMNLYPRDAAGTTVMTKRYSNPVKEDDMWIYIPSLRRVRRFPTSQRCSTIAPTVYTNDDIYGFRGKVPRFNYQFVGDKKLIALCHQKHHPVKQRKGSAMPQDEDWEVRDFWVVKQTPKDPSYCYSKRIFYYDKEFWENMHVDIYDRKGEYWKAVPAHVYTKTLKGEPDIYFSTAGTGYDFQSGHKTFTYYEWENDVGIKVGEFALSNMVRAARMGRFR
ncbi:MAG: DUF1329 domain-containing protein [Thermodesulfobacteriota bacterium]|nr:DUF1329 domain-containing protein [Thermodesulfobacteriota bacterium]